MSALLLLLSLVPAAFACPPTAPKSISLELPENPAPPLVAAADDVRALLSTGFPKAEVRAAAGAVRLRLARVKAAAPLAPVYPKLAVPPQGFTWTAACAGGVATLTLKAASDEALAHGLYALLQEKLGYRFHHPRESVIPEHRAWPLAAAWTWKVEPRFSRRGFHLHTQHPTELAEQLHSPNDPHALDEIDEYFKWLARNGQNLFSFYLLRDIDREDYPAFGSAIVRLAHARGIRAGVHVGLSTFQQRAFQMVQLLRPWPRWRTQIARNVAWLERAGWDFVAVDMMTGEHGPRLGGVTRDLAELLFRRLEAVGMFPVLKTHVIPTGAEERGTADVERAALMAHSVMFYSLTEEKAPVYGHRDQRFMREWMKRDLPRRDVWYWPESAYWITFDIDVPQLLLPYLSARLDDIRTVDADGVDAHLTFSSGWEWGYWLVDWSVARWSWGHADAAPLQPLFDLVRSKEARAVWTGALAEQEHALKERELIRLTAPATIFDELPRFLYRPFQPAPPFTLKALLRSLSEPEVLAAQKRWITPLEEHARKLQALAARLPEPKTPYEADLRRALQVTALRPAHRAKTLRALIAERSAPGAGAGLLQEAAALRARGAAVVLEAEKAYRYPASELAVTRPSVTAYPFGYLRPVHGLFFWEREEGQIERKRFDWRFRNVWDVRRIVGLDATLVLQPGVWSR